MSARTPNVDPLRPVKLPAAIRAQSAELLHAITNATTRTDIMRAADLAEGFVLGMKTVRALSDSDAADLLLVFSAATQMRLGSPILGPNLG